MNRDMITFEPSWGFEEGATFTKAKDRHYYDRHEAEKDWLIISVAEEQAVDSYNQSFECSFHMDMEQVAKLRDWLNKTFPA